jgi:hypothetical protein
MDGMAVSDEDRAQMQRNMLHAVQVQDGLIPADSPPGFTLPQPTDAKGLPWWFGPGYKPTPEALAAFGPEDSST